MLQPVYVRKLLHIFIFVDVVCLLSSFCHLSRCVYSSGLNCVKLHSICCYIVIMFTELLAVITSSSVPMAGQSFSLTCSLTGGASLQPTLSYQWTRDGGSLMTSTATLNFDTLNLSDAGIYSCQVILTSSQLEGGHTVAAHYTIKFMGKLKFSRKNFI